MISHSISVLLTGSEVLDGRVQDTNANFIARSLSDRGLRLEHFLACDDRLESITESIKFLLRTTKFVVISGGIGPTSDDLTREAVAELTQKPLKLNEEILRALKARYAARRRHFDESNVKQALFPEGAMIVPNALGTAAGFSIELPTNQKLFILPGVPFELEKMFLDSVLPEIVQGLGAVTPLAKVGFRVFGLPESAVGMRVKELKIPDTVQVSYRANFPEIEVVFKSGGNSEELERWCDRAIDSIGREFVFTEDFRIPLDEEMNRLLKERKLSVSVAESCTGGGIGQILSRHAGSAEYFRGGSIAYTEKLKEERLGVSHDTLKKYEVVSKEVAIEMADGVKKKFSTDIALSITGALGPTGGTEKSPVGTYCIGIADKSGTRGYQFFMPIGDRIRVAKFATWTALDVLRIFLLSLPLSDTIDERK